MGDERTRLEDASASTSGAAASLSSLPAAAPIRWGAVALRLVITALLFAVLAYGLDLAALGEVLARVGATEMATLIGLVAVLMVLYAARWVLVLRALGERARWLPLIGDVLVGLTYNLVLPTTVGGDVVRAVRAGRRLDHAHHAWSSSIYERLAGFATMALAAVIGVLASGDLFSEALWLVIGATLILVAVFWRAELIIRVLAAMATKASGAPVRALERIQADLQGPLARVGPRFVVLGLSLLAVGLLMVYGAVSAYAVGAPEAALAMAVAMPVSQLAGAVPISINGLGLREGSFVLVAGAYGFEPHVGAAVALLLLLGTLLAGVAGLVLIASGRGHADAN